MTATAAPKVKCIKAIPNAFPLIEVGEVLDAWHGIVDAYPASFEPVADQEEDTE